MKFPSWLWKVGVALVLVAAVALGYLNSLQLWATDPVSHTGNGAIDGYDPVAYFKAQKPVRGDPRYIHEWHGATWRFASEENRAAFAAAPERYAPQFGGYCAFAVASGYTAKSDPEAWHVEGDRLYLNFDQSVKSDWMEKRAELIPEGAKNWPRVIED